MRKFMLFSALSLALPALLPLQAQTVNPYPRFLDSAASLPLTPAQKLQLSAHNLSDPGNLATITYTSAFTMAADSHTAYGPGWNGFLRNARYGVMQDATSEFFGTFAIPSLLHEDPRYHRVPRASIPRRVVHAIAATVIAESDNGAPMPNYATLLTYPISAEVANLSVPGVNGNGPSTAARILTGYATDPIDNLLTEFLPGVARRVHVHVILTECMLNRVSSGR